MENKFTDIEHKKYTIEHFENKNVQLLKTKERFNNKLANVCIDNIIKSNVDYIAQCQNEIIQMKKQIDEYSIFDYNQLIKYSKLLQDVVGDEQVFKQKTIINGNVYAHVYSYDEEDDNLNLNSDPSLIDPVFLEFIQFVITCKINADKVILTNEELFVLYTNYYNHIHTDSLYLEQDDGKSLVRKRTEK